jgi:predicted RNA-binding protein with PUA-like domain
MAYWLFQGNPKYYKVVEAIAALESMYWPVTRYAKEIAVGDGVLIWVAGAEAGIYGIAEIVEAAQVLEEVTDKEYWLDTSQTRMNKPQAKISFLRKLIGQPLRRQDLKQDLILKELLVLRAPNSTNFKVTPAQWERVHQLKG